MFRVGGVGFRVEVEVRLRGLGVEGFWVWGLRVSGFRVLEF